MFSNAVKEHLKFYVYRLIDPRNGETFYVGKGTGNRVFSHGVEELRESDDAIGAKLRRIRDIRMSGFEVAHVIHRHGMDEETAIEVEAALIDAYPETANLVRGQASDDRGLMHARQIIDRYEAPIVTLARRAMIIHISRTAAERDIYDAVRFAWKIDPNRAARAEIVLAVIQGLIVGVFVPDRWVRATAENFPAMTEGHSPDRWGFEGHPAPEHIANDYLRHRLPESMRLRGAQAPVRYSYAN